jgi:Bacterial pre-peptidase C-terminal domain
MSIQFSFLKLSLAAVGAVAAVGTYASAGHALTFTEPLLTEAGSDLSSAASAGTVGTGLLTNFINGKFDTKSDSTKTPKYVDVVDLFKVTLNASSILTAQIVTPAGNTPIPDPVLFLFDSTGQFLGKNDNQSSANLQALLVSSPLSAGTYYLGITPADIDAALDSSGMLTGWTGSLGSTNSAITGKKVDYRIELTAKAVPTPALLPALLGLGAGILRQRKQQEIAA